MWLLKPHQTPQFSKQLPSVHTCVFTHFSQIVYFCHIIYATDKNTCKEKEKKNKTKQQKKNKNITLRHSERTLTKKLFKTKL